ncbi:MAG: hypothetical protein EOP22_03425 [Hyphomicrobiales bacterium]|nr:MAG: hypothetical protein EOP22_03425 [Hyphomicrobiales bacterium]
MAFWIAAVPALLLSTASVQAAGFAAAGLSLGGSVIKLPSGQNGILTSGGVTVGGDAEPLIYAPNVGFNAAVGLGKWGEYDAFAGLNLFASYGGSSASLTQTFSGIGTVYIPGLSLPDDGAITLGTSQGSSLLSSQAAYNVVNNPPTNNQITDAGAGSTLPNVAGQTAGQVTISNGGEAFVVGGMNTDGDGSALAYGGIADPTGSLLIITGDLDGLSISTNTTTRVLYAGGDITVGVTKLHDSETSVQAYAGPSYRYLGQWTNTDTTAASMTVNIPEVPNSPTLHPLWIQETTGTTSLSSHYFGGVAGAGMSRQVAEGTTLSIGAEASLYYLQSHLAGGGSVTTRDGQPPNSPLATVVYDPVDVMDGGLAFAVRGQASASFVVAENLTLGLTGTVDYLSKVARPYAGAAVVTAADGDVSWSSSDAGNTLISFGDMFVFTGAVSLNGHF